MNLSYLEESGNYVMKNHLLLVPAEWMLNEKLSRDIEATKPILKKFVEDMEYRNIAKA